MDITAHTYALVEALRGTRDTDPVAQQKRIELVGQVNAFVTAWRNLSTILKDCPRTQPQFEENLTQLQDDSGKIVLDLRRRLESAQTIYGRAKKRSLFFKRHKTSHRLAIFFEKRETLLRQQQVAYATAVVNLLALTVLYEHDYLPVVS